MRLTVTSFILLMCSCLTAASPVTKKAISSEKSKLDEGNHITALESETELKNVDRAKKDALLCKKVPDGTAGVKL